MTLDFVMDANVQDTNRSLEIFAELIKYLEITKLLLTFELSNNQINIYELFNHHWTQATFTAATLCLTNCSVK